MATFSTNEVRQIIVGNSVDTTGKAKGSVVTAKNFDNKCFFIEYVNADGQLVKSDYINYDRFVSQKHRNINLICCVRMKLLFLMLITL